MRSYGTHDENHLIYTENSAYCKCVALYIRGGKKEQGVKYNNISNHGLVPYACQKLVKHEVEYFVPFIQGHEI